MAPKPCNCGPLKSAILTLDGGGMRGFSSLLLVQALMIKCGNVERELDRAEGFGPGHSGIPLPCHYFDYIVGTSTGGLIAIMLARLRMHTRDALDAYESLAHSVFGHRRPLKFNQFDYRKLEQAIKGVVKQHCLDKEPRGDGLDFLADPDPQHRCCRTALLALRRDKDRSDQIHVFRSYFHPRLDSSSRHPAERARVRNAGDDSNTYIWQAARATSAAPHYFKEIDIGSAQFMDGGIEANNPSDVALSEVKEMHVHDRTLEGSRTGNVPRLHQCLSTDNGVGVLVSVGTGAGGPRTIFSDGNFIHKAIKILGRALKVLTDPEPTHRHVEQLAYGTGLPYYRLNVETGLEKVRMDECRIVKTKDGVHNLNLEGIRKATDAYLRREDVETRLTRCAERLVNQRRNRCANGHAKRFRGLCKPGPLEETVRRQQKDPEDIMVEVNRSVSTLGAPSPRASVSEQHQQPQHTQVSGQRHRQEHTYITTVANGQPQHQPGRGPYQNRQNLSPDDPPLMSPRVSSPPQAAYEIYSQEVNELRTDREPQEIDSMGRQVRIV